MSEISELMENLHGWMAWASEVPGQSSKMIQLHAFLQDVHDALTVRATRINDYEAVKADIETWKTSSDSVRKRRKGMSEITAEVTRDPNALERVGYHCKIVVTLADGDQREVRVMGLPIDAANDLAARINDYNAVLAQRDEAVEKLGGFAAHASCSLDHFVHDDPTKCETVDGFLCEHCEEILRARKFLATVDKESEDATPKS